MSPLITAPTCAKCGVAVGFGAESLAEQVIIADDGSNEQTRAVIEQYQQKFPIPLIHSWQPDTGFKLAESRNRALAQSTSAYIVVIDGDMVMHPEFIQDHLNAAKKGVFIQGGRVVLPEEKTAEILRQPEQYPQIKWYHKGLKNAWKNDFQPVICLG